MDGDNGEGDSCGVQIAAEFPVCASSALNFLPRGYQQNRARGGALSYSAYSAGSSSPYLVKVLIASPEPFVDAPALGTWVRLEELRFTALHAPNLRTGRCEKDRTQSFPEVATDHGRCIFSGSLWVRTQRIAVRQLVSQLSKRRFVCGSAFLPNMVQSTQPPSSGLAWLRADALGRIGGW